MSDQANPSGERDERTAVPVPKAGELRHRLYSEQAAVLNESRAESFKAFDQAILTLSAAGLGLSLTFIKDVVPIGSARWLLVLPISWGAFALAILSTMGSFIASRMAADGMLDKAEQYYIHGDESQLQRKIKAMQWTGVLNWVSAGLFAAGVVLTTLFVALNTFGGADNGG